MDARLLLLALLCSAVAHAGGPAVINSSPIDNSGAGYQGNFGLNQAAGDQQQQANTRAIAIGANGQASAQVRQRVVTSAARDMAARAVIGGDSFSSGDGALGVNQSAGAGNQQVNVMRISVGAGPQSVDDSVLSQQNVTLSQSSGSGNGAIGSREVGISDQAFAGSRGVVQLNQSAGVGNRMGNTLSIRVE
ncbi:hypothetical protein D9M71_80050 [compost metagenome]